MEEILKYVMHKALKSCRHISEAEWHHTKLIVALVSAKSYFWDIRFMDPYLVLTRSLIQLGEDCRTPESI